MNVNEELRHINAKLDQILALLGKEPNVSQGVTVAGDGRVFIPGTGWTGQQTTPDDEQLPPASPADARAALHAARTASPTQETHPQ